jgi:hypothetical protein
MQNFFGIFLKHFYPAFSEISREFFKKSLKKNSSGFSGNSHTFLYVDIYSLVMDEKGNSEKKPMGYREFGTGMVILVLVILFLFLSGNFPASCLPPAPAPTMSPVTAAGVKDLAIRTYNDYLAEGQSNAYYFDVSPDNNVHKSIQVIALAQSGNSITSVVGFNYVPSLENNTFDSMASTSSTSSDVVIQIENPGQERYYVMVKGIKGSGDTRVSRSLY